MLGSSSSVSGDLGPFDCVKELVFHPIDHGSTKGFLWEHVIQACRPAISDCSVE
jgi:hypothetical protein